MHGSAFKHYMNPLHIYCRLRDLKVGKHSALTLAKLYERLFFKRFRHRPDVCDLYL
jgi:hypothetical protein